MIMIARSYIRNLAHKGNSNVTRVPTRGMSILKALQDGKLTVQVSPTHFPHTWLAGFRRPRDIDKAVPATENTASKSPSGEFSRGSTEDSASPDEHEHDAVLAAEDFAESDTGSNLHVAGVMSDLEQLIQERDLTEAQVDALADMPEWKAYDQHVSFEMNLVRARYTSTDEAMTDSRRAQMSAHLKHVKGAVMEEHAEAAADKFLAGLSEGDRDRLAAVANQLSDAGMDFDRVLKGVDNDIPVPPMNLQDSMAQLVDLMGGLEQAAGAPGQPSAGASGAALNVAMDEIAREMGVKSREELMSKLGGEAAAAAGDGGGKSGGRTGR